MYLPIVIILLLTRRTVLALPKCNGTVSKLQLCSIHDNYNKQFVNRGWENFKFPMSVTSSITLFDIAEINENKNTVTLQLLLKIFWHDGTLRLETNNEYASILFQYNYFILSIMIIMFSES